MLREVPLGPQVPTQCEGFWIKMEDGDDGGGLAGLSHEKVATLRGDEGNSISGKRKRKL